MALDWLPDALAELDHSGLLRVRRPPLAGPGPHVELQGRQLLNLCSNDYLSLAALPVVTAAAAGAGASRLVGGHQKAHAELEQGLADWLELPASLLFTSGYAANVGALAALAGPETLVVSDAQNHASIVDGCRLSRARVVVVPHRDLTTTAEVLRRAPERRRIVATDGYFSMDGDRPDLVALRALCDAEGAALYVDEAHALGVYGPDGRGACAAVGLQPDVLVGTLGKAFGAAGAFVAGSSELVLWLWNRARSFVFSTGTPAALATTALERLQLVRDGVRTRRLQANAAGLRAQLISAGVPVLAGSEGPIIPVVLGDPRRAVAAAERLLERGLFLHPMRPPTVPVGTSRLRITVQADHTPAELEDAAAAIAEVVG
jgi:8-amino-7-oxononanoate synthase